MFQVTMDVQQFKVGELTVKVVDQCIVIEGKHKDRKDYHGFIARSFTRKFFLPKTMDPSTLSAKLSLDGLLTVTAVSKVSIRLLPLAGSSIKLITNYDDLFQNLPAPRVQVIDICCTRKRALSTSPQNKTPAKPAAKSAAKPMARSPKKPKVNKAGRPKPLPQRSGTPKPQEGGSLKPQPPKQSGRAQ